MSNAGYYVRERGRVVGPVPMATLKQMVKRGQVSRASEVSTDRANWSTAADVEGLFAPVAAPVAVAAREEPEEIPLADDVGARGGRKGATDTSDSTLYFYAQGGQAVGPVPLEVLRSLCANGTILPNDPVWRAGDSAAVPANRVPALAAAYTQAIPGRRSSVAPVIPAADIDQAEASARRDAVIAAIVAGAGTALLSFAPVFLVGKAGRPWWALVDVPGNGLLVAGYMASILAGLVVAILAPLMRGKGLAALLLSIGGIALVGNTLFLLAERGAFGLGVLTLIVLGTSAASTWVLVTARACFPEGSGIKACVVVFSCVTALVGLVTTIGGIALLSGFSEAASVFPGNKADEGAIKVFLLMFLLACFCGLITGVLGLVSAFVNVSAGLRTTVRVGASVCSGLFLALGVIIANMPAPAANVEGRAFISYLLLVLVPHGLRVALVRRSES